MDQRGYRTSAYKLQLNGKGFWQKWHGLGELPESHITMNRFYIGDICWVIPDDEYQDYVLPVCTEQFYNSGYLYRGKKRIDFLTGDASASGWPQDSGVLGVLRFDDLEPEYQERAERLAEGGYVAIFESEADGVLELSEEELHDAGYYEEEIVDEERALIYGVFND